MKKIITTILTTLLLISSSFAFDTNTFWKQYSKAITPGANIASVGIGINGYTVSNKPASMIPEISLAYEKAMFFADMLPISIGGYANIYGVNYFYSPSQSSGQSEEEEFRIEDNNPANYFYMNFGALAKYHFDLGIDNLDVYTGAKVGLNICSFKFAEAKYEPTNKYTAPVAVDLGYILGATYYFTPLMGATLETGFPGFLNVQFNVKF